MVQVDPSTILLIGGTQDGRDSAQCWKINPINNFLIEKGPSLKRARYGHSCGLFYSLDGQPKVIVAGGFDEDSVEILDPSSPGQGWEEGIKSMHVME